MLLSSPAFSHQAPIPDTYTCRQGGLQPPLDIKDVPATAKSLAIIMHDPDAPGRDFLHWTIWNIPAQTQQIATDHLPEGSVQGLNDFRNTTYGAPCPPSGTHHYIFDLYALDMVLNLPAGSDRSQLEAAISGHIIEISTLSATVSAD